MLADVVVVLLTSLRATSDTLLAKWTCVRVCVGMGGGIFIASVRSVAVARNKIVDHIAIVAGYREANLFDCWMD